MDYLFCETNFSLTNEQLISNKFEIFIINGNSKNHNKNERE